MPNRDPREALIFALDVDGGMEDAMAWVERLRGRVGMFKVGKESFTRWGPSLVRAIISAGGKVFLDLKFHDIPNTVAAATEAAVGLGVSMLNVHAAGGRAMMEAAVRSAVGSAQRMHAPPPILLAVTVLTSLNDVDLSEIGFRHGAGEMAIRLSRTAKESGMSGVVASAHDASAIREACGKDFIIVTPGIRGPGAIAGDDQKRVWSPSEAVNAGADYLVIGRPIRTAADPSRMADEIVCEIADGISRLRERI